MESDRQRKNKRLYHITLLKREREDNTNDSLNEPCYLNVHVYIYMYM